MLSFLLVAIAWPWITVFQGVVYAQKGMHSSASRSPHFPFIATPPFFGYDKSPSDYYMPSEEAFKTLRNIIETSQPQRHLFPYPARQGDGTQVVKGSLLTTHGLAPKLLYVGQARCCAGPVMIVID
jgi:hypothetical protein